VNNICENISKRKEILESNIDSILNELEEKFDEKMKEIKSSIIPQKEKVSFISSSQDSFIRFASDPNKLIYKGDLCNTAHKFNSIDKVFCAFKSFSGESYVVWGTPIYSLEFFNIEKNQIINTIKEAHMNIIFSCRHYPDKKNKIDYIITSSYDRNVKIWNLKSFSYNLITNTHNNNYIYSVCLLFEENENKSYVITSSPSDFMKVWDFTGKLIDTFGLSDEGTYFIDTYYDTKNNKYYILNGNVNDVKSYSFSDRKPYKKYIGIPQSWHMSALVYQSNEQEILIESDGNGFIRLWEFHTSNLIKSIFTYSFILLRGICLWNEKYLFAGANDHQIKLYDLINGKFVKLYKEHTGAVCTLEKIVHNKYGECLLSQALDGKIKIWSSH
jgi:WD40 repeat protein